MGNCIMNSQYCHLVHFLFAAIFHTNMVNQHGNKSASWVRVRDGHILYVDRAIFRADQRFQPLKQPDKSWTLQIKYVQAGDAGAYECQVSTEPRMSAKVHLRVGVNGGDQMLVWVVYSSGGGGAVHNQLVALRSFVDYELDV